jgi:hypothetical protein
VRRTIAIRDPEPPREDALRLIEQERRREWFRDRWTQGVAFNQHCGIEVRRWDDEAVELFLPYAEMLSAHSGIARGTDIYPRIFSSRTQCREVGVVYEYRRLRQAGPGHGGRTQAELR